MAKEIKIVRKDKLLAGYNGNLESVIVHNKTGEEVEVSNGVFVTIGALVEGEREVKVATLADAEDLDKDVYFIHNSEVMYDERLNKLEDFVIPAGKVARAYSLNTGDVITLTEDLYAEAVTVGDKLAVKESGLIGKLGEGETAKVEFEVIEDSGYELHETAKAFAVGVVRK